MAGSPPRPHCPRYVRGRPKAVVRRRLDLQARFRAYGGGMELRIGQLAKRSGLSSSALRYYESAGILPPARRSDAGYRLYGEDMLGRLAFVRRAQALGLSVREIRSLLREQAMSADEDRGRLRHLVAHRLAETQRRLAELSALQQQLQALHVRLQRAPGPGCGHLGDCACWLPTEEEVKLMAQDVACCEEQCCPECCGTQDSACECSCCA